MAAAKPKVNAMSRFGSGRPVMPVRPARMMDLEVINEIHALCFEANHRPLLGADAQPWWNDSAEKLATCRRDRACKAGPSRNLPRNSGRPVPPRRDTRPNDASTW